MVILFFSYKMLIKFIKFPRENVILVDKNNPKDWDDAMKIISNNKLFKYMSKSITLSEMDGVAIGMYKFNSNGAKNLFRIIRKLIKRNVKKSWVSEAINIMSKTTKINLQISNLHAWADVDNLVDLKSANEIINNMEHE